MRKENSWLTTSILILFITFTSTYTATAQTACTQTLRLARTVYDEGRIHELEELLSGCIANGFNDEERTEAYRLLILSYIYLDETAKADETMLALLRDNHAYEASEQADPTELYSLYKTFRTKPIFFYGPKFNINTVFVNVINAYSVLNSTYKESTYNNAVSFGGGLMLEKNFGRRLIARSNIEFNLATTSYSATETNTQGEVVVDQLFTENLSVAGLGLMAQFRIFPDKDHNLKKGLEKANPYVGLGGSFNYIVSSGLSLETDVTDGSSADGPEEDLVSQEVRTQLNPTADVEFGVKLRTKLNYFTFAVRYSYGLLDVTDKHFVNGPLTTFYGYAANDINMNMLTVSLGFLIPQYVPKKLN